MKARVTDTSISNKLFLSSVINYTQQMSIKKHMYICTLTVTEAEKD